MTEYVSSTADIRGNYRYALTRVWNEDEPMITWVLLNPSTADETQLDRTLERCEKFSTREGFGGMLIANVYAFRAPKPRIMKAAADPVGPDNDRVLAAITGTVVAGWGNHASPARIAKVVSLLPPLLALGTNDGGQPTHPLYVKSDAPLTSWKA